MFLKMELFIVANGKMGADMAMEFKFGQMERSMKDTGKIIRHMVKESFGMLMEMYLMEDGKMIKLMDLEYIHTLTALNMKVTGRMIYNMEKVLRLGQMVLSMMVHIKKEWKMGLDITFGQMEVITMDNG